MNLLKIRTNVVLIVVFLYLLFDHGFQLVRIPPGAGFGVPIGEFVILFFIVTSFADIKHFSSFASVAPITIFLIWFAQGITQIFLGLFENGFWAMRDATFVIESFFVWIGFVVSSGKYFFLRLRSWLNAFLTIAIVYSLGYPFREYLEGLSPRIVSANGKSVPIFFNFVSTPILIQLAALRNTLTKSNRFNILSLAITGGLLVYALAFWQSRTIYLQIIVLGIILAFFKRDVFSRLTFTLIIGFFLLLFALAMGIEIEGRIGQKISLEFFVEHFEAIWGKSSERTVDAANGFGWRLELWSGIWNQLNENTRNLFFGLGFGEPLIDFLGPEGEVVRIPHNTIMTILGRMGLIGLTSFVVIHIALIRSWFLAYRYCKTRRLYKESALLLILLSLFSLIGVYGIGESSVEMPYLAIPYYFFWGIVLRMRYNIKLHRQGNRFKQVIRRDRKTHSRV